MPAMVSLFVSLIGRGLMSAAALTTLRTRLGTGVHMKNMIDVRSFHEYPDALTASDDRTVPDAPISIMADGWMWRAFLMASVTKSR